MPRENLDPIQWRAFMNSPSHALHDGSSSIILRLQRSVQMQKRFLNLQEFQSKKLMDKFGVRTQKWIVATTKAEAEKAVTANLSAPFSID